MKECGLCHEVKPLATGFYKHKGARDGYRGYCRKCHMKRLAETRDPDKKRISDNRAHAARRKRDADRVRARAAVYRAVQSGRLTRPGVCEVCGGTDRIHGHHADYSRPLDVEWLCWVCHHRVHGMMGE